VTQQWGTPGQQPAQGGQQWPGQPNWNRPAQAWGPQAGGQPQFQPPQQPYPQQQAPYPQAPYGPPQGQFGQPAYGQPGGFQPANRPNVPGGPRRQSPFRGLLLGLVLIVGIGFFGIALTHYLGADPGSDPSNPTPTRTTAPPVAVPEPDFSPPAVPQPETYGEATDWLTANKVYDQTAPVPTDCAIPQIDMVNASVGKLTDHLNVLTGCLWRVWSTPLKDAGFQLPRPPVTVYTEPITTGCGKLDEVNAVYCAADQHIYYAKVLYKIFPADQQKAPFVVEAILAHEFGHTIQARTGILISSMAFEQKVSKAEARVYSRRLEVQADCFSGMFTEAVGASSGLNADNLANLGAVMYNLGDDVLTGEANYDGDHGLGKSRKRWFTTGQQNTLMGKCNTYTVAPTQVR
jgi:predicted metalloprotease